MELETIKRLIKKYEPGHTDFVLRADVAKRYYRNETDILYRKPKEEKEEERQVIKVEQNKRTGS